MAKQSDTDKLVNQQAAALAAQVAQQAAALEFQKTRFQLLEMPQFQAATEIQRQQLQLQMDQFAFDKAEQTYKDALQEATITGTYKGQPTLAWLEEQAKITGVLNGQQTLEGKLNDAQIAQMQHAMELDSKNFELNYAKFGADQQHWTSEFQETQTNNLRNYLLQEAGVTGQFNGQDTLEKQRLDSQNALSYLGLLANAQGNPFKTLRIQQNAGTFNNLAQGFLGNYEMAGSAGVTGNPGQATVGQSLLQYLPDGRVLNAQGQQVDPNTGQPLPMMGYTPAVVPPATQVGVAGAQAVVPGQTPNIPYTYGVQGQPDIQNTGYTYSPPGTQAAVDTYNYQPTPAGQTQVYPPGVAAPVTEPQYSTTTPQPPGALGAQGIGTGQTQATGALTPNKVNAANYQASSAGEKKLLSDYFVNQGWTADDAQDVFLKSLPKYGGPARGTVRQAA